MTATVAEEMGSLGCDSLVNTAQYSTGQNSTKQTEEYSDVIVRYSQVQQVQRGKPASSAFTTWLLGAGRSVASAEHHDQESTGFWI